MALNAGSRCHRLPRLLLLAAVLVASCRGGKDDNGPLYAAIVRGDTAEVEKLLSEGRNPNSTAVRSGLAERSIQRAWKSPPPPLLVAISEHQPGSVKALLAHGARVDFTNPTVGTPLEHAIAKSDAEATALLLAAGADAKQESRFGFPLLFLPACEGQTEVVRQLLDRGAAIDIRDREGGAVKHCMGELESVFARLKGRQANRIAPGATPLLVASQAARPKVVELLLTRGADVNARDDAGRTALMLVLEEGISSSDERYIEVVRLLLEKRADPSLRDSNGDTAIDRARTLAPLGAFQARALKMLEPRS